MSTSVVRTSVVLWCLLWLICGSLVYSMFGPPCMSQLGLKYDGPDHSLTFDLAVSDGEANNVRLNAPKAWIPQNMRGSFVEINVSEPVLLTALQVQGDPLATGRVTGWLLDTSLDCENYHTENYSTDFVGKVHIETVLVKNIKFVSCIRVRPTQYTGETPALRFELLGCAVNDNTRCGRDVYPTREIWLDGGVRQLNFDHEVVLDWVKVLLELKLSLYQDTFVEISYSRTCERWKNYDPLDLSVISVTSSDQRSRWLTVDLEVPIRVKCLRITPPLSTILREVHASGCSSYLASSLRELVTETDWSINKKDAEVLSTAETTTTIEVTETTSAPTVLPQESMEKPFTTESYINGMSNSHTSTPLDISEIKNLSLNYSEINNPSLIPSPDYSEVKNLSLNFGEIKNLSLNYNENKSSSVVANEFFLAVTHLKEINPSSEIATPADSNSDIKVISEEHTIMYNTSMTDFGASNESSTTKSLFLNMADANESRSEESVINEMDISSTSAISGLHDTLQQLNSTSTTYSRPIDMDILPESESTLGDAKYKDYNETVCGVKKSAKGIRKKRVIGGTLNTPGEWPWLVSMHYLIEFEFTRKSGFKHTCGASLVAPGWVITAAHCFSDDLLPGLSNLNYWRIYFGAHDLATTNSDHFVQERLIEAVYSYPSYDILAEPLLYDLALVKLNETVEINERVSPVCLDNDTDIHGGEGQCYVSGWGQIRLNAPGSRYPHSAALSTMTLSKCKDMYDLLPDSNEFKQYARIEPPVLCAAVGDSGEDACQGDSGGPLMCERDGYWYQSGIVASGYLCGHKATPGLYTRIAYYSDWIRSTMELFGG